MVKTIGEYAFADSELVSLTLTIDVVPSHMCESCEYLTYVDVNARSIGYDAFRKCPRLTTAHIRAEIIGSFAFFGCGLLSINLVNAHRITTRIGWNAFSECTDMKYVVLPEGLLTIGHMAFMCSGITSVELPASVTHVGQRAFAHTTMAFVRRADGPPIQLDATAFEGSDIAVNELG